MLEQPPLPEEENSDAARMYLEGSALVAEVDAAALAFFQWQLWSLAADGSRGEEISISSVKRPAQNQDHAEIGYCEITLTGEGPIFGKLHNPNAEFLHRGDRVDLSINRLQAGAAYKSLKALSSLEVDKEVTLFGRLVLRIVKTRG